MKKGAVAALIVLLAGAGGAAGWYYYNGGSFIPAVESKSTVYATLVSTIMGRISGAENRFAGVVEAQETVAVQKDPDRKVSEVKVKVGDEVKKGQILFEYDLSSIEDKLNEARLELERLQNEAIEITNQINTTEAEKTKKENADKQLELMIQIQQAQLNLKKNEYDQKSKEAEIVRLENATGNTLVTSEIDGIVQKIDTSKLSTADDTAAVTDSLEQSGYNSGTENSGDAFITILSTGEYRVKGTVNELNRSEIVFGQGAIIRSRADETMTWHGIMGNVDSQNSKTAGSNDMYSSYGNDSMTSSSSYPFYVELESSEGLMLGQHVYIEIDVGQEEQKSGIWLQEDFIDGLDTDEPFVWAADENSRLVKKPVTLGEHDMYELKYEILDGITEDDYIAFPSRSLEEGMPVKPGTLDQTVIYDDYDESYDDEYGMYDEYGEYGDEMYDESYDMMPGEEYADEDGVYKNEIGIDSGEIFDDTEVWDDSWYMDESTGDEPYVMEGDEVYVVDDAEMGFPDENVEIIDDFPEDYPEEDSFN
ncbi:MAG: efflux RND transporter periplasmic adaptor subunit [Blautia sp.]|nr:efflux RND transporter periplasmic adaptor subunit [Blautia sp.]